MKRINYLLLALAATCLFAACNKVSYRKTKSGLEYKIFPGNTKDSLIRTGNIVKFAIVTKLNDSVLYNSYERIPAYAQISPTVAADYSLFEILPMMRRGDSAITVQMVDTLLRKGSQLPPMAKQGDRITIGIRIIRVFDNDSIARADYNDEMIRDRPRQMKAQAEMEKKMLKEQDEQIAKMDQDLQKSGEIDREFKQIESILAGRNIKATRVGKGVYVRVDEKGSGPAPAQDKYITVKYDGRTLDTDSAFEKGEYTFQMGHHGVIRGWEEGISSFQQGGKGTLYIPGFLAYGQNGGAFKPYQPLQFDIEVKAITDTLPPPPPPPAAPVTTRPATKAKN